MMALAGLVMDEVFIIQRIADGKYFENSFGASCSAWSTTHSIMKARLFPFKAIAEAIIRGIISNFPDYQEKDFKIIKAIRRFELMEVGVV